MAKNTLPEFRVKIERTRENASRTGLTIYEVPKFGLFRVHEINAGEFEVSRLAESGWTKLIGLDKRDDVSSPRQAMQVWIDIQTPTARLPRWKGLLK